MGRCSGSRWPAGSRVGAEVLLADEPTSELDEGNRGLVLAELRQEAERGAVVVVATHDPAVVDACDRHYVLDDGMLVDHVASVDLSALEPAVPRGGGAAGRRGPVRAVPEPSRRAAPEPVAVLRGRHAGPHPDDPEHPDHPDHSAFQRPSGPA